MIVGDQSVPTNLTMLRLDSNQISDVSNDIQALRNRGVDVLIDD